MMQRYSGLQEKQVIIIAVKTASVIRLPVGFFYAIPSQSIPCIQFQKKVLPGIDRRKVPGTYFSKLTPV